MTLPTRFLCTRFACLLAPASCVARQDARFRASPGHEQSPKYPGCASGCKQGAQVRADLEAAVLDSPEAPW